VSNDVAPYGELGAAEIARLIRERRLSCVEVAAAANVAIAKLDGPIHAFATQPGDAAVDRARELDKLSPEAAAKLPLLGVPVAVKDIFDTAELPTEYGSPIYRGYRPRADAALVSLLRAAGAVIVGKTKSSEFAWKHPSDTRNPLDLERTPGGSSSGSAAAVAARMVPLATGTQTAGSIVRPASYCGVLGLKPTPGVLPRAGGLPTSATHDTAGLFARNVDDLELALAAMSAAPAGMAAARASRSLDGGGGGGGGGGGAGAADPHAGPRIGFLRIAWDRLEAAARNAIEDYLGAAATAGAVISQTELPAAFELLADAQETIQQAETAWALGGEADWHGELVSPELRDYIAAGRAVTRADYLAARRLADEQRWQWQERLGAFDAVLAPSTLGVPPTLDERSTGDSLLCRPFTLLGGPALALPGAWTPAGLPIGLQLVGAAHDDRALLGVARWLLARVGDRSPHA
jgi:Asp-tRNA(Asn)/Glu-tRNA(Gln) amidotransferase A subunit family amidase